MTESELRAAAEDVVQWYESLRTEYGAGWKELAEKIVAVLRGFLAEHPADSELPVDESWLLAVGFEPNPRANCRDEMTLRVAGHVDLALWVESGAASLSIDDGRQMWTPLPVQLRTRGAVRRLCAALGVPLSEAARA